MDSNIPALKTYITTQRENGIGDDAIYQALLSSGWQHDLVVQALATQVDNDDERSVLNTTVDAPIDTTLPVAAAPEGTAVDQPLAEQSDAPDKNRKKVKIIGIIMIALGVLAVAGAVFPEVNMLLVIFAAAQILIGLGILSFNKIAYTLFNVLAILAILSSLFVLPSIPFVLFALTIDPMMAAAAMISVLLSVSQLCFYIYSGIVFHKKDIRLLFHKKREQS